MIKRPESELDLSINQLRDEIDEFDKAQELADEAECGPQVDDPGQCYNCGFCAKTYDGHTYVCPRCGDEWDIWFEPELD